jgi:predicted dinucleotide-binding enzyme
MFIAGDDEDAKATVSGLLTSTGWDVSDLGGIEASRHLEAMGMVWVMHGITTGSWDHAFKMLTK